MNNSGLCRECFSHLSLLDKKEKEESCHGAIFDRGALFPAIPPLENILSRTLLEKHDKMVAWFCSLLVLQADLLNFPWCDALFFVPGRDLKKRVRDPWEEELSRFFQVPVVSSDIEKLLPYQTIYLIDWYLRPDTSYEPVIAELETLYPHTFILLSIFDHKPFIQQKIGQIRV